MWMPATSMGMTAKKLIGSQQNALEQRSSARMTKEELIEVACEVIGDDAKELSADQIQGLMTVIERLADLSLNERRSFGNLCIIRAIVDAALARRETTHDLVTLRLTKEQCVFLLALVEKEIREHA
jgi:hypothetical protein